MKPETLEVDEEITIMKNRIGDLRKRQVQIQKLIEKQEDNEVYDDSLYAELDNIDEDIANIEVDIFRLSEEW